MHVICEEKQIKRCYYKSKRDKMSREEKNEKDSLILSSFLTLEEHTGSEIILAYASKIEEINTKGIIEYALSSGKKVALPKSNARDMSMEFYFINSYKQLTSGSFNVFEPKPEECVKVLNFETGTCVVPGYCFDNAGYRLGYGKGFYDRFLAKFKGVAVGLCYEDNIEKHIVTGKFDKRVDAIITEKGIKYTNKGLRK